MITIRPLTFGLFREYQQVLANIHEAAFAGTKRATSAQAAEQMFVEITSKHAADIYVAEFPDGCAYGYALGFQFEKVDLKDPHFEKFKELGAKPTDYYYALIGVVPGRRKSGAADLLLQAQLKEFGKKRTGWSRTWIGNRPVILTLPRRGFSIVRETKDEVYFKRERK